MIILHFTQSKIKMKPIIIALILLIPFLNNVQASASLSVYIDSIEIKSNYKLQVYSRISFNKAAIYQDDTGFVSKNIRCEAIVNAKKIDPIGTKIKNVNDGNLSVFKIIFDANECGIESAGHYYSTVILISSPISIKNISSVKLSMYISGSYGISTIKIIDNIFYGDRLTRKQDYKRKLIKIKRKELIATKNANPNEVDRLKKITKMKIDSLFKNTAEKVKVINHNNE